MHDEVYQRAMTLAFETFSMAHGTVGDQSNKRIALRLWV